MAETIVRCPPKALQLIGNDIARGGWYALVPAEVTIDQALSPDFFGLFQQGQKALRVRDVIEIEPEDGRWNAHVRVMYLEPGLNRVHTRLRHDVEDYTVEIDPRIAALGYRLHWLGTEGGWSVQKLAGKGRGGEALFETLTQGLPSMDAGRVRLDQIIEPAAKARPAPPATTTPATRASKKAA